MKADPGIFFWFFIYFALAALIVAVIAAYRLIKEHHQYDTFQKVVFALSIFLLPLLGGIVFLVYSYKHDKKSRLPGQDYAKRKLMFQEENR